MRGGWRSWIESATVAFLVIARSVATKQSMSPQAAKWIASGLARNDGSYFAATVAVASSGKLASSACSVVMVE